MLVLPEERILVVHNFKTGGSSVTQALIPWLNLRPAPMAFGVRGWHSHHNRNGVHMPWSWLRKYAEPKLEQGWRLAVTTRNPWERVESAYRHASKINTLPEFVAQLGARHEPMKWIFPATSYPATDWIRTDRLAKDLSRLVGAVTVPHIHRGKTPADMSAYTTEAVRRVGEFFASDVEEFGYAYES